MAPYFDPQSLFRILTSGQIRPQRSARQGRRRKKTSPLVRSQLGADAPVPRFRRSLVQSVDTKVLADTLAVAVNELGMAVPTAWAHQSLGIPQAEADAAIVSGRGRQ